MLPVAAANTFNIGADIGSMAAAAGLLVPVPQTLAAVGVLAVVHVDWSTVLAHTWFPTCRLARPA